MLSNTAAKNAFYAIGNLTGLIPGRHYEFEMESFTSRWGLPVPDVIMRREFIELMTIGKYQFIKVSREGGVRHLLAAEHIRQIRAVGVVVEFRKDEGK